MNQFFQIKQVTWRSLSYFTVLLILSCNKEQGIDEVAGTNLQIDVSLEAAELNGTQFHSHTVLFNGGTEGYHSYRIPALVRTTNGTLLAFAEGRATADYKIAALVEYNEDVGNNATSHRSIEFHRLNIPWILDGQSEPQIN